MVIAVEAYVGPRSGSEGVKLEQMVLITEEGTQLLTEYPLAL
jgi:Xaa-Pro aminopeptidase